jgi:hypothetical protein
MYQWLNDNPRMAMHNKGKHAAKTSYDDWQDVTIRNGHAAAQEFPVVQKYQELLRHQRDIPVHSQWVQLNEDNPDGYTVSITLPTIPGQECRKLHRSGRRNRGLLRTEAN